MDQTTRNARVIGIHLSRVQAHMAEAFRELNRIDPAAFPPDLLKAVQQCTAVAWNSALELAAQPVIPVEKKAKAKKEKAADPTPA